MDQKCENESKQIGDVGYACLPPEDMIQAMAVLFIYIMGQADADKDNKDIKYGQSTMEKIKVLNVMEVQSGLVMTFSAPMIQSLGVVRSLFEGEISSIQSLGVIRSLFEGEISSIQSLGVVRSLFEG